MDIAGSAAPFSAGSGLDAVAALLSTVESTSCNRATTDLSDMFVGYKCEAYTGRTLAPAIYQLAAVTSASGEIADEPCRRRRINIGAVVDRTPPTKIERHDPPGPDRNAGQRPSRLRFGDFADYFSGGNRTAIHGNMTDMLVHY